MREILTCKNLNKGALQLMAFDKVHGRLTPIVAHHNPLIVY